MPHKKGVNRVYHVRGADTNVIVATTEEVDGLVGLVPAA